MRALVCTVADENGLGSSRNDGRYEGRDAGAMLNREGGRGAVTQFETEGALNTVAETGVRSPLAAR